MKHIRTKDGKIIDLTRYDNKTSPVGKAFGLITLIDKKRVCDLEIFERDILKQADTIEELVDEFVLHYGDTIQTSVPIPWATYERRDNNWQKYKEKLISELKKTQRKAIVYGAIWTDKGLIYVAKMNSKGELELL